MRWLKNHRWFPGALRLVCCQGLNSESSPIDQRAFPELQHQSNCEQRNGPSRFTVEVLQRYSASTPSKVFVLSRLLAPVVAKRQPRKLGVFAMQELCACSDRINIPSRNLNLYRTCTATQLEPFCH